LQADENDGSEDAPFSDHQLIIFWKFRKRGC